MVESESQLTSPPRRIYCTSSKSPSVTLRESPSGTVRESPSGTLRDRPPGHYASRPPGHYASRPPGHYAQFLGTADHLRTLVVTRVMQRPPISFPPLTALTRYPLLFVDLMRTKSCEITVSLIWSMALLVSIRSPYS